MSMFYRVPTIYDFNNKKKNKKKNIYKKIKKITAFYIWKLQL